MYFLSTFQFIYQTVTRLTFFCLLLSHFKYLKNCIHTLSIVIRAFIHIKSKILYKDLKKTFKTWAKTSLGMISAEVPAAAVVDDEATIMDCCGVVVSVSTSGSSLRTDGATTDELIILFTILLLLLMLLLLRLLPNSIEVNWFVLLLSLAGTTMGIADWCWRELPKLVEKMCEADDCECELVDIAAIAALLSSASAFLKYKYFNISIYCILSSSLVFINLLFLQLKFHESSWSRGSVSDRILRRRVVRCRVYECGRHHAVLMVINRRLSGRKWQTKI